METKTELKKRVERTVKSLERELRDAKAEIKEDQEIKERMKEELKELKQINQRLHVRSCAMVESLIHEGIDLTGRLHRIDMRIRALGFDPETALKAVRERVEG